MKKFTNMSGAKVGKEPELPKMTNEEVEEIEFKNMVMKLMDDILSIRSYGSARPEIMIPTKIVGKEMFVEALSELISKKSMKEAVKVLESLKSTNKDWKSIEDKIQDIETKERNIKEEKKILDVLNKWSDEESLKIYLESRKVSKEEAEKKCEVINNMGVKNPMLNVMLEYYKNVS
jgi:hypothetical protein